MTSPFFEIAPPTSPPSGRGEGCGGFDSLRIPTFRGVAAGRAAVGPLESRAAASDRDPMNLDLFEERR